MSPTVCPAVVTVRGAEIALSKRTAPPGTGATVQLPPVAHVPSASTFQTLALAVSRPMVTVTSPEAAAKV
jgi:hypothetical protein